MDKLYITCLAVFEFELNVEFSVQMGSKVTRNIIENLWQSPNPQQLVNNVSGVEHHNKQEEHHLKFRFRN